MLQFRSLLLVSAFLLVPAVPSFAQGSSATAPSKQTLITGTVVTFDANILDIKPATSAPSVWVTIPRDLKVDRNALKPGTEVSVKAYWATVCYMATEAPEIMSASKSAGR